VDNSYEKIIYNSENNFSVMLPCRKIIACDELQKLTGTNDCPDQLLNILETVRRHRLDFFASARRPIFCTTASATS